MPAERHRSQAWSMSHPKRNHCTVEKAANRNASTQDQPHAEKRRAIPKISAAMCHTHREKRREIRGLQNLHSEPLTTMPFAPGVHKATGNRSVYSGYREYAAGLSGRVDIGEIARRRRLASRTNRTHPARLAAASTYPVRMLVMREGQRPSRRAKNCPSRNPERFPVSRG